MAIHPQILRNHITIRFKDTHTRDERFKIAVDAAKCDCVTITYVEDCGDDEYGDDDEVWVVLAGGTHYGVSRRKDWRTPRSFLRWIEDLIPVEDYIKG